MQEAAAKWPELRAETPDVVLHLIGQLQPHSPARFTEVTMDQALAARHDRQAALARLRAHLGR